MMVGSTQKAKFTSGDSTSPEINDRSRNDVPSWVKSSIFRKIAPTNSIAFIKIGTFRTRIAMINCMLSPMPITFQFMDLRLLLIRKPSPINTAIPNIPLRRAMNEKPEDADSPSCANKGSIPKRRMARPRMIFLFICCRIKIAIRPECPMTTLLYDCYV